MLAKLTSLVAFTLFTVAIAGEHASNSYDCNHGYIQCCGQLSAPTDYSVDAVKSLIGAEAGPITGQVGFQCNPVSVIGLGSTGNCAGGAQCCKDYYTQSMVGVDCTSATGQI